MTQAPVVVITIGQLGSREALVAHCGACQHSAFLDLPKLIEQFGADLTFDALRRRLRCAVCGSRDVALRQGYDVMAANEQVGLYRPHGDKDPGTLGSLKCAELRLTCWRCPRSDRYLVKELIAIHGKRISRYDLGWLLVADCPRRYKPRSKRCLPHLQSAEG